jgi:DNA polymerase-3 subunit epsilon
MVTTAPRLSAALPAFFEFAGDCVLVAHNAPFDVSFLKAGAAQLGMPWPGFPVLDTAHLARQLVPRDEAPNRKLGTLAALFGAAQTPDHRALHDASATVDVLHALMGRVGNLGVTTLEELTTYSSRVSTSQRRKRHLADRLPSAPGVYLFKDARGQVLYVGTSQDIRRRVRTYFTASEHRSRMGEMVSVAESVTAVVCATPLEAQVRELRLIAEHEPRYNRRSRRSRRRPWVKLTAETYPRLSIVAHVRADGATYLGPFSGRRTAEEAVAALHDVLPLRRCSDHIGPRTRGQACVLFEMGRCGAPCEHRQSAAAYAEVAAAAVAAMTADCRHLTASLRDRMATLARDERYEDAAVARDRMSALVRGAARAQRVAPLAAAAEIVAARRAPAGGWEVASIRYGRLAGTTVTPRGADPMPFIDALRASAEVIAPGVGPAPATTSEETEVILAWLERDDVRLVHLDGTWSSPAYGAAGEGLRSGQQARSVAARSPRSLAPPPPSPAPSPPRLTPSQGRAGPTSLGPAPTPPDPARAPQDAQLSQPRSTVAR